MQNRSCVAPTCSLRFPITAGRHSSVMCCTGWRLFIPPQNSYFWDADDSRTRCLSSYCTELLGAKTGWSFSLSTKHTPKTKQMTGAIQGEHSDSRRGRLDKSGTDPAWNASKKKWGTRRRRWKLAFSILPRQRLLHSSLICSNASSSWFLCTWRLKFISLKLNRR